MNRSLNYNYVPRVRKVKHVKFFKCIDLDRLESSINTFADDHPDYKILGIRVEPLDHGIVLAVVTYLEDSKTLGEGDYYESYEESDSD